MIKRCNNKWSQQQWESCSKKDIFTAVDLSAEIYLEGLSKCWSSISIHFANNKEIQNIL